MSSTPTLWPAKLRIQWLREYLSLGMKWPGREAFRTRNCYRSQEYIDRTSIPRHGQLTLSFSQDHGDQLGGIGIEGKPPSYPCT
jgi:hypothetical protein